jgi:hypothetical protein
LVDCSPITSARAIADVAVAFMVMCFFWVVVFLTNKLGHHADLFGAPSGIAWVLSRPHFRDGAVARRSGHGAGSNRDELMAQMKHRSTKSSMCEVAEIKADRDRCRVLGHQIQ